VVLQQQQIQQKQVDQEAAIRQQQNKF
jgi:hypothetical protein